MITQISGVLLSSDSRQHCLICRSGVFRIALWTAPKNAGKRCCMMVSQIWVGVGARIWIFVETTKAIKDVVFVTSETMGFSLLVVLFLVFSVRRREEKKLCVCVVYMCNVS